MAITETLALSGQSQRVGLLDAVRGLAAFSVLVTHLVAQAHEHGRLDGAVHGVLMIWNAFFGDFIWCNGGLHAGVVVFIVLSGFCIHMPVARRPQIQRADGFWRDYTRKRAFRILPVYWFATLLGLSALVLNEPGQLTTLTMGNAVGSALLLNNFTPSIQNPGNDILMTVAVECLLYAIYPLGLHVRNRYGWSTLFGVAMGLYTLNFAMVIAGAPGAWMQRNVLAFLPYWYLGAYAAEHAFNQGSSRGSWVLWVGMYVLYLATCHLIDFHGSHFGKSLVLAAVTAQLLVAMTRTELRWRRFTAPRFLVGLGVISYSLYAYHWPIMQSLGSWQFTQRWSNDTWLIVTPLCVFLFASIFYFLIEWPFHVWAKTGKLPSANSLIAIQFPGRG